MLYNDTIAAIATGMTSSGIAADLLNLHKQVDQKISEDLSLVRIPLLRKQYHAHVGAAGNPCSLTASIAASDARLYRRICMVCANDCRDSGRTTSFCCRKQKHSKSLIAGKEGVKIFPILTPSFLLFFFYTLYVPAAVVPELPVQFV